MAIRTGRRCCSPGATPSALDVFRDDTDATDFYAAARPIIPAPLEGSPLWDLAYNALNASVEPMSLEAVIDAIGVRPTAGGAMPKMLLPIISPDGSAPVDALVKFNDREYEDLLVMEKIGYDVFERFDERTPRCWIGTSKEGCVVLATERFDRVNGLPVPLESLFSTMFVASRGGISARWSEHTTTPNFEMVGAFMRDERVRLTVDPAMDAARFYRRIVANVLIGNSECTWRTSASSVDAAQPACRRSTTRPRCAATRANAASRWSPSAA